MVLISVAIIVIGGGALADGVVWHLNFSWPQVAAGDTFMLALSRDRFVYCWGKGTDYVLPGF
jgi:hypothetical protein